MNGWDFCTTTTPVARKNYTCDWCGESIETGTRHRNDAGKYDGDMVSQRLHLECAEAIENEAGEAGYSQWVWELRINPRGECPEGSLGEA